MKPYLHSALLALCFVLFFAQAKAQTPDNGVYPGGVEFSSYQPSSGYSGNLVYEINNWKLDSILDAGTPIILDLFATWCGPCWSYHTGGTLEQLYDSKGWGGTGEVAIFGVEADSQTAPSKLESSSRDWINNTKYPMADAAIGGVFNLKYFPTIIMICPDRTVTEIGQKSLAEFTSAISTCKGPATMANDVRLINSNMLASTTICQATSIPLAASVVIQNYSTDTIQGSYTIEVSDASNTVLFDKEVTLNLAPYEYDDVTLGDVQVKKGNNAYHTKIVTTNDDTSNDEYDVNVQVAEATGFNINADKVIQLDFDIDGYASELGFALREGNPASTPLEEYQAANSSNSLFYLAQGSLSDGTTSYSKNVTLNDYGCHYLVTYDKYGDGITYNHPSGSMTVSSASTKKFSGEWGKGKVYAFDFKSVVANEETLGLKDLSVNPSLASTFVKINFELNQPADVQVKLINTLGQTMFAKALGQVSGWQDLEVNTSTYPEGSYFVHISVDGQVSTRQIFVVR